MTACAAVTVCVASDAGANAITPSPGAKSSTPSPTAITSPAHSRPSVGPVNPSSSASSGSRSIAHMTSRKFNPAARTLIATWPGPGRSPAVGPASNPTESSSPGRATASRTI